MKKKLVYKVLSFFVTVSIIFSLCACGNESESDRGKTVAEDKKENEIKEEETETKASISGSEKVSDHLSEKNLIGRWYLENPADDEVIGYQFYKDGTWLAVSLNDGDLEYDDNKLLGTWKKSGDGSFRIFDHDGNLTEKVDLYVSEEMEEICFDLNSDILYKCEDTSELDEVLALYMDSWLCPTGNYVKLKLDGTWILFDDTDNTMFGGHWIMDEGDDPVRLRMYNSHFDHVWGYAILDKDASGEQIVELIDTYYPLEDASTDIIMYRKY